MQTLTLEQLRASNEAGGVLGVTLKAQGPAFLVSIETRRGEMVMVTARKTPRKFVDPRRALLLLRDMGIRELGIDAKQWRPEEVDFEKCSRPDAAMQMKAAHEALSHTEWLRDKLSRSAADPRPRVPHEQVMNKAQAIIDRKKANAETAA